MREIENFNPNCVHFTVPDFVALDAIKWCQRRNVAYIATCKWKDYFFITFWNINGFIIKLLF